MDIILETRKAIAESKSDHNDGYVKEYYKDRLIMLKEILDSYITPEDIEAFKRKVND